MAKTEKLSKEALAMRKFRANKKKQGLTQRAVYVHTDDWPSVQKFVKAKNAARGIAK